MRIVMILVLALWANLTEAAGHQCANAYGVHGMVLLKTSAGYVASHMPLHNSIHAHQVIFLVGFSAAEQAIVDEVLATSELVTLEPEAFDLCQLIRGELPKFRTKLVNGHFERGGKTVREDMTARVAKRLLSRALMAEDNGHYQFIPLAENSGLLVHQIGKLPSFDQILWVTTTTDLEPGTVFTVHSAEPQLSSCCTASQVWMNRSSR